MLKHSTINIVFDMSLIHFLIKVKVGLLRLAVVWYTAAQFHNIPVISMRITITSLAAMHLPPAARRLSFTGKIADLTDIFLGDHTYFMHNNLYVDSFHSASSVRIFDNIIRVETLDRMKNL